MRRDCNGLLRRPLGAQAAARKRRRAAMAQRDGASGRPRTPAPVLLPGAVLSGSRSVAPPLSPRPPLALARR